MKAIDILKWIVDNGIDGKALKRIDVPDEPIQTEEWWWKNVGGLPPSPIESGTYICIDEQDERILYADMCNMDCAEQVELEPYHCLNLYLIED